MKYALEAQTAHINEELAKSELLKSKQVFGCLQATDMF